MIPILNAAGGALERVGVRLPSLEPDVLVRKAVKKAGGLEDFGDPYWREGLERLCASLEGDADLNTLGRIMAHANLVLTLANRLRVVEHLRRNPAIGDEPVERPIFIVGLPRSGTTILHALMAEHPATRSPLCWECSYPWPPPTPETYATDPRIARMQKDFDQLFQIIPELRGAHLMDATTPQECIMIHSLELRSIQFTAQFDVSGYTDWVDRDAKGPVYRAHRRQLQYLQSGGVRGRWLLKSPVYLAFVRELLEVYPDAVIVQTHRDPAEVMASVASLMFHVRKACSRRVDPVHTGRQQLEWWAWQLRENVALRKTLAAEGSSARFVDVQFRDFVRDPVGEASRVYEAIGLPVDAAARARLERFARENPRHARGRHDYDPAFFGLDPDALRERFADYIAHFDVETKGSAAVDGRGPIPAEVSGA